MQRIFSDLRAEVRQLKNSQGFLLVAMTLWRWRLAQRPWIDGNIATLSADCTPL